MLKTVSHINSKVVMSTALVDTRGPHLAKPSDREEAVVYTKTKWRGRAYNSI